ncbi:MAG: hypothetical protein IIZ92_08835, partial [Aquincola sp.]|nr:hypothetical protein [Aquincola sp.]
MHRPSAARSPVWRLSLVACAAAGSLGLALPAHAVHFDIELRTSSGPVAGSRISTEFFGDLTGLDRLPVDHETGWRIFPGYFGDFEGGTCATDDPGFQAFAGHFLQAEELHFRALGSLLYWNPATGQWGPAPAGVSIALFGAVPPELLRNYIRDPATWATEYGWWQRGTRFSSTGVAGPRTAAIARTGAGGTVHAHLDWMISGVADSTAATPCSAVGSMPAGAYRVTLEVWSTAQSGGKEKYVASPPVHIVFEYGLSEAQLQTAIVSRVQPPLPPLPP